MSGGIFFFPRIPMLVLMVGLVFYLRGPTFGIRRAMAPIWILLAVVLAVSVAASGEVHLADTAIRFANFAGGILLLAIYLDKPRDQLAHDYYAIGKLFSIQSILTIIAATVIPGLFMTIASPGDNADYQSIAFTLNYHVMLEDATRFHRPDGFFYEPAVFQIFLNIQLYLALFVFNSRKWAAVALLGVLATQSTTSLLISLILVGVYYIRMFPTASSFEKFAGAMLGPLIAIPLLLISAHNFDDKFAGRGAGSTWAREFDAYTGLRIAVNHPLFGIGFNRDTYKDKAYEFGYMETPLADSAVDIRTNSNSNGIVTLFYTMGFPLALIFLFGLYRQRFFRLKPLVFVLFFFSLIAEPLSLNPFFLMFTFSGMLLTGERRFLPTGGGRGGQYLPVSGVRA
ncbi:O-antigen ligase family protein [Sphingomonas koreensis]